MYVSESYGIRIEDDALVVDAGDNFIAFERMNLGRYILRTILGHNLCLIKHNMFVVPYEHNLINYDLLSVADVRAINAYHQRFRWHLFVFF